MSFRRATEAGGAGPARRLRALLACSLLAAALLSARSASAEPAGGAILVGAGQAGALATLLAEFRRELAGTFYFPLATADSERAVMQRVAARPGDIGLVQRDLFLRFRREDAKAGAALEFYAYLPACLVAVVRAGSPLRGFGDLVAVRSGRRLKLDIGPAAGSVAASFADLRRLDPALDNLELEHRGGSFALEHVVDGTTDAALRFLAPPFPDSALEELRQRGKVALVPFASRAIALAAARDKLPYASRRVELPPAGWLDGERSYQSTCTELGVLVNAHADPSLTEAIAGITLREARSAGRRPWYRPLEDIVAAMLTGVGILARGAVETVVAWLEGSPPGRSGVALVRDTPAAVPVGR